ncbi:54S ribosomal protein L49 mitochondrial [Spathaspora sp. JA1]|nr:54S ribosomal protein L49 mitochondrial [Spathaspora sp. JA1]
MLRMYSTSPLTQLKVNSNGNQHLYAIFKLHNMPYLVTKGDLIYLNYKLQGVEIGDELRLNDVTTLGSPSYTYNEPDGIDTSLYSLKANVVEITREPKYEVVKTKPRQRREKTFQVENFQTVLRISELAVN